jgi:four helix bundle protein
MPRYTNLLVFQRARTLVRTACDALRGVRGEGDLVSQIRRAAISVAANIAEGAERGSDREFVRFLRIADGSNAELQALITIAEDAGVIATGQAEAVRNRAREVGRMIGGLLRCCVT